MVSDFSYYVCYTFDFSVEAAIVKWDFQMQSEKKIVVAVHVQFDEK